MFLFVDPVQNNKYAAQWSRLWFGLFQIITYLCHIHWHLLGNIDAWTRIVNKKKYEMILFACYPLSTEQLYLDSLYASLEKYEGRNVDSTISLFPKKT